MTPQYYFTPEECKAMRRDCDGICSICGYISLAVALPDAEGIYCVECENRSVVGIDRALAMEIAEKT